MASADDVLIRINAGVTGAGDITSLSRLIGQMNNELRATGENSAQTRTQLERVRDSLLQASRGFAAGSAEATRLASAAAQVQTQLNGMTRAANAATVAQQRQAAAAQQAAQQTAAAQQRQADAARAAAAAAAQHAAQQAQANSLTSRVGGLAQDASAGLGTLRAGLLAVIGPQIIAGLRDIAGSLKGLADEANKADTTLKVFELTMNRFKVPMQDAEEVASRLSQRFGASMTSVRDSMTVLVRAGFRDMGQLERVMTGAAASAIAFGRTAEDGFDRVGDAAVTGLSAALNAIGISENLGPAMDKYAKSIGKTADGLNEMERAQVVANLVLKATATEVDALDAVLNDYTRSQQENKRAQTEAREEIGRELMPAVTALTRESTRAIQGAMDWARANRSTLVPALKDTTVFLVEAGQAMRVLIAFLTDLGTLVGGVGTVLVGFGLTVAGGLEGGIRAALSNIQQLFTMTLQNLAQLQVAWKQLTSGDVAGALNTAKAAFGGQWSGMQNLLGSAGGNVMSGIQQGAQWGLNTIQAGAGNVGSVGGRTNDAIATGDASVNRVKAALGMITLPEFLNALGVGGYRISQGFGATPFAQSMKGKPGYEDGTHKGLDIATPEGTRLYSPVSGRVVFGGWDKTGFGNLVKIIDDQGRQILLGHLQGLSEELKSQMAKGNFQVKQGDLLGRTGNTGQSTAPHLHLEVRDAQGRPIDPQTLSLMQQAGLTPGATPDAGGSGSGDAKSGPITDAQIAKARQLQAAIDAAVKANNPQAWNTATAALKRWEAQSEGNRAALEAVRATAQRTARAATDATEKQVQAQMAAARKLAEDEARVKDSGTRAEREAVAARVKAFNDTGVAQREALQRARDALNGEQQMRDRQAREAEQAAAEAKRRAEAIARDQEQAQSQLTQLTQQQLRIRTSAEQDALTAIEKARTARLKQTEGDLQLSLTVEQNYARRVTDQARQVAGAQLVEAKRAARAAYDQAVAAIPDGASAAQARAIKDAAATVQTGAISEAYRTYYGTIGDAAEQGRDRVTAAQRAITDAIEQGQRDAAALIDQLPSMNLGGIDARAGATIPEQISLQTIIDNMPRSRAEVAGFERALRELNAEGKISADVLSTALLLIPTFGAELGQVGEAFAETEAQLDAQAKRLDDLNGQYERGEITQDAYRDSLAGLADDYGRQALAAERAGRSNIAAFFRSAATEAMKLAEGVGYVSDALRQLQEQIDQNGNDAAAFAGVDALFEGDAATVAARLADEIASGVPEQLSGPARDRFAAGLTRWIETTDLSAVGSTLLNGLLTKLDGKDSAFAQQLTRVLGEAADGIRTADLDGAVSAIVQRLSDAEGALGPDGLLGADAAGVNAYVNTLRDAIPLLERVATLAKGTSLEGTVSAALDGTRAQLDAASARLTELFQRFEQAPNTNDLEQLLEGISGTVEQATRQYQAGLISVTDYNDVISQQGNTLDALLSRLERLGSEYAAAAESVRLLRDATRGATVDLDALAGALIQDNLQQFKGRVASRSMAYQTGQVSAGELASASTEDAQAMEQVARNLERIGRSGAAAELRAAIQAMQQGLPAAAQGAQRLQGGFGKFQTYAGYAQQLAGSFGQLAGAFGNDDLAANLQGIANFAGKAISLAGDVAKILANPADIGAWVSAITTIVSSIADAIGGFKKAQAEAAKAREEYQKGFSIINTDAFASFTVRSRGWFADTFGGGPEVVRQINEFAANIARTIEQGVKNGFSNGIKSFLNGTGDLLSGIREGVRGAIIDAVTQALIEGAILKGALGTLLTQLTTALTAGQDPTSIIGQIAQALPGVARTLEQTLTPIKTAIDAAFPGGSGGASGGGSSFGSGSSMQVGVPTVLMDVLNGARDVMIGTRELLSSANEAGRLQVEAGRLQVQAGRMMLAAAERMMGPHAPTTLGSRP